MVRYRLGMKHTVTPILWKNDPNPEGLFPIYYRIYINGKKSYKSTGYFIAEKYWDNKEKLVRGSHSMANIWNADILDQRRKLEATIIRKKMDGKKITVSQAKKSVQSSGDLNNYFGFVDNYIQDQRHRKKKSEGTLENYRKHALRLEQYNKSRQLNFEDITGDYLVSFETALIEEQLSRNYVQVVIRSIRTMFNAAKKKGQTSEYPFTEYDLPKYQQPVKDYLSLTELGEVEKIANGTKDPVILQTCIYFLLGCYTGLRVSDWYAFSFEKNVKGGMVMLRAMKNGEWVSIPITKRLKQNLQRIKKTPLTIAEQTINDTLKKVASQIKSKGKWTTHTGRHTFAITMCAEQGISLETCATMMGITVQVCYENYYRVTPFKIKAETEKAWEGL